MSESDGEANAKRRRIASSAGLGLDATGEEVLDSLYNDKFWGTSNGQSFLTRTFASGRQELIPSGFNTSTAPEVHQNAASAAAQKTAEPAAGGPSERVRVRMAPSGSKQATKSPLSSVSLPNVSGTPSGFPTQKKKDSPSWGVAVEEATELLMGLSYQDRLRALRAINAATGFPQASLNVFPTPRGGYGQTPLSLTGSGDERMHDRGAKPLKSASAASLMSVTSLASKQSETNVIRQRPPKGAQSKTTLHGPDGSMKVRGPRRQDKQDINNDPVIKSLYTLSREYRSQIQTQHKILKLKEGEKVPENNPVVALYRSTLQEMHAERLRFRNVRFGGQSTKEPGS